MEQTPKCPVCGSNNTVPICYGYPAEQMFAAADSDEVYIGGCSIADVDFHCNNCRNDFQGEDNAKSTAQ